MPVFAKEALEFPLPKMVDVKQIIPDEKLDDPYNKVLEEVAKPEVQARLEKGKTACVLVGSRGIDKLSTVVKGVVDGLKAAGVEPFIIPAMGSHGGGIAERQRGIIEGYGVTEETMGCPIKASMDVVQLGTSEHGIPCYVDKYASEADYVVPVGRVKVHTDFKGPIESGLCKMMVIGIGKHTGCARVHQVGFENFHWAIPEVAKFNIEHLNVPFGMAMIENGYDHLCYVEAVPGDKIMEREPELLEMEKNILPRLFFDDIDVLVVEKIGKNISGAGMDPNIIGRVAGRKTEYWKVNAPDIKIIVVYGLTEESHGSAVGIGMADFTVKEIMDKIDYEATYANQIAAVVPMAAFIPIALDTREDALRGAIVCAKCPDQSKAKVVWIHDTLELSDIKVSESLLDYCRNNEHFIVPEETCGVGIGDESFLNMK